jgi:hypothetical protein
VSSLPGHARITEKAVERLAENSNPVYRALGSAGVPVNVVARDLIDVVILGHWADFGQCHHFMRRFDGQSEHEAYNEAVHWIWRNGLEAANLMSRQIVLMGMARPGGPDGGTYSGPTSSQSLGNALHALQDSFAAGHAERGAPMGPLPGEITRIKRYAGSEKDGHEEADKQWKGNFREGFSESGWLAVEATLRLLRIVVDTGAAARGNRAGSLLGFDTFRAQWLRAADSLSTVRDRAFDLIDKYTVSVRLGAMNLKTINMDEDGLAQALIDECGTNTALVLDVFTRLRDHYSSDSDDVAEIYVNAIRKNPGQIQGALRANPPLVRILIQVMDEGWTSAGEKDCIAYLKGLL